MSRIIINKKKAKFNLLFKKYFFVLILIFISTLIFWLISTNFKSVIISNYIEFFSKKYNYLFTELEISGLNYLSEKEINRYFEIYYNKSIFLVPTKEVSKNINKNNWVESVKLKNNFKNKISINIKEFDPIAVYFNGKHYLLINRSGNAIDFVNNEEIPKYIILEGQNSRKQGLRLIEAIPNKLKSVLIKAKYINNRRWDIFTKENLKIKLPEIGYKKAMNTFIDIYDDLFSSEITNIEYIDLRIPKKAIIKFHSESN